VLPPNTPDDGLKLIERMDAYYTESMKGFEEDDAFYEGELEDFIDVPEGFNLVLPTTPRAVVDEAVDNASPQEMKFTYSPRGADQTAEEHADRVRSWTKSLWRHWRVRANDIDPIRDFEKNLAASGKGVFKLVPDLLLWPSLSSKEAKKLGKKNGGRALDKRMSMIEEVREKNTPLFLRSLPPRCIMEDPNVGGRKLWIIEVYEDSVEEVRNTYGLYDNELVDIDHGNLNDAVTIHELWTAPYLDYDGKPVTGKHFVYISKQLVLQEDNPYPFLPYVVKFSGWGRETYDGRPETKSVGFYTRQNKSMFLAQARAFTNTEAIMAQLAFPIGFLPVQAEMHDISFFPGAINYVDGLTLENIQSLWVKPPIPDREYAQHLNLIGDQLERGTVQRALRGAGVPGTDSAAQYGLINAQARLRIAAIQSVTEQAVSEITSMSLQYADEYFEDDVSVPAGERPTKRETIGPGEIRGHTVIDVSFVPNEEAAKERKLVLAADAWAKGLFSRYDSLEYAGFDEPSKIIAKKRAEDIMEMEPIKMHFAEEALADYGMDADELEMEQRVKDARKQIKLREIMQSMQVGTMPGIGDPTSPTGVPPQNAAPFPVAGGAPAGVQAGPVAGIAGDINALRGAPPRAA